MRGDTDLDKMYAVANDTESDTLTTLRVRAGLLWQCVEEHCGWYNTPDASKCDECGNPKEQP